MIAWPTACANSPRAGFAYQIYDRLAASNRGSSFDDRSIPGATTRDVLVKEVPLLRATSCSLLLLAVGANDIQRYSSPKHFAHDYAALLDALRKKFPSSPLIVTGIPDLSVTRTIPFFARPLTSALSAIDNAVVLRTAAAKNAYVIDLYALSKGAEVHRPGFFSGDGLHPSDAGHHTLSDFAFPVVERALRRR